MPSINPAALSGAVVRPALAAIAHLPILIIVVCAFPVWLMAVVRPKTHGDLALRLLRELRTWSKDVTGAVSGGRS